MSHFAFFDALQTTQQDSAEWELISCGYMVMRCFDDWCAIGPVQTTIGATIAEIKTKIHFLKTSNILYANVFGAILQSLVEATDWKVISVIAPLIAYGYLLEVDCKWALAADVYGTVSDALDHEESILVSEVLLPSMSRCRQALSLRTQGKFDEAEFRYRQAIFTADRVDDSRTLHYARLGLSSLYRIKGDFSTSLELLNTMLAEHNYCEDAHIDPRTSEIFHNRGALRLDMGDDDGAFSDLAIAYQSAISPVEKDVALSDLAACALKKGYYDFAQTALTIVLDRCPLPHLRQLALLNMTSLAVFRGDRDAFAHLRTKLEPRYLGEVVTAFAHLAVARGIERFGTPPQARTAYRKAAKFAEKTKVPKVHREALERLAELQK